MNNRSGIILTMGILLSGLCFSCSKQLNEGDSPATFDIPDFPQKPERFREEFETRVSELLHNPDSAQARSQLALFFHANAQYTQASDLYLQLIEEDHSDGRWPYYLARILQDRGQSQEAIRWLKASVERNGDFALSYLRLGDIYLKTDQVEKANVAYKQCLERAVDNPHALLGLARLEIQRKNWSGARDHLLKSIASNPDILTAYSLLTIVAQELGENELAAEARRIGETKYRYFEPEDPWLEELYDHCFDPYQLSVAADMYLNTHRESKALALLQLAIDRDPERARTYLEAAKAHLKVQDTKQGIDFLKQAIRLDPQIEDAHYQLVSELESSGNLKTALAASQAAIRVNLHSAGLYRQQGVLLEASGQATQAVAAYRKAVELDPGDEKNSEALANFYWTLGETKQAVSLYEKVRTLSKLAAKPRAILGNHYLTLGNLEKARQCITEAYEVDPELDGINELRALCFLKLGNEHFRKREWELAEKAYFESLRSIPDSEDAITNLINLYSSTNRVEKARVLMIQFIRSHSATAFAYPLAAEVELKLGNQAQADRLLQRGKKIATDQDDAVVLSRIQELLKD